MEYKFTCKDKPFFDGYERGIMLIRRHGWNTARDMLNEQYPHDWKPQSAEQWQHAKGCFDAIERTM